MKFAYEVISIILWFHNLNSHLHSSAMPGNKEAIPKSIRLGTLNVWVYDSSVCKGGNETGAHMVPRACRVCGNNMQASVSRGASLLEFCGIFCFELNAGSFI